MVKTTENGRKTTFDRGPAHRARLVLVGVLFLGGALVAGACGPAMYTLNLIPASQALEQAEQVNADEHAPYEYYFARESLKKAREEASEASYEDAIRFAEDAERFGNKARDLSRRRMRELGR